MATGKRYYWIKLKESFFTTSDAVDYLMEQDGGANYIVLYQMLCLKTANTGGRLSRQIGEVIIPYDEKKIFRDTKGYFSMDTIRIALRLYQSLGLIYQDTDGTLVLADHGKLVGSETDYAEQKRSQRTTENQLPAPMDNVHTDVHSSVHTDIDIDIEKDIEIDIEKEESYISTRSMQTENGNNGFTEQERAKANRLYSLYRMTMSEDQAKRKAYNDIMQDRNFLKFWNAYPRHENQQRAEAAFAKCQEPIEKLLEAIAKQKQSDAWNRDGGRYIPTAERWLSEKKWTDELTTTAKLSREPDPAELPEIRTPKKV